MIDGLTNSVVETDIIPVEADTGSDENYAGNAFVAESTILKTATGRDYSYERDRRWSVAHGRTTVCEQAPR